MKKTTPSTLGVRAAMTLLALFCFLGEVNAQKSLPYRYGFENCTSWDQLEAALTSEGWSYETDSPTPFVIGGDDIMSGDDFVEVSSGSYAFVFGYVDTPDVSQYLISPEFAGDKALFASFWCKRSWYGTDSEAPIQVGYSTTTKDISAFTWKSEWVASDTYYERHWWYFPEGTKYIAIKYTSPNKQNAMFVDDFYFEDRAAFAEPTDVAVTDITPYTATITWTPSASYTVYYYEYQYKNDAIYPDWGGMYYSADNPSVSLSDLKPGTEYSFRVNAHYGWAESNYVTIHFTTDCAVMSVPYTEDFEDGLSCWSRVDCDEASQLYAEVGREYEEKYGNSRGFIFTDPNRTGVPQYLVSPEFDGNTLMTLSFWHHGNDTDQPATFQLGYSTTTKDISAFTWGETLSTTSNDVWEQYEQDFPLGTKFMAIRYTGANNNQLYLDDFSILQNTGHWGTWLESCKRWSSVTRALSAYLGIEYTDASSLTLYTPCYVLENVSEEEARALAEILNAAGGTAYAIEKIQNDGTTGINATPKEKVPVWNNIDGTWHTLSGLQLKSKPMTKGLYIYNGYKVVIE